VRTGHGGCRFCAHKITVLKKTKTKAQIFKYLRSKGYEPIRGAVFKSSRNPIECKHLPCGRIVKARYFSIQQGRGCCNHCGTQAGALKWANTKSDVLPLLKKKKIILLDKNLKGMRQKHRVKCKKCDLVWSTRLSSLTSQIGCPGCADYGLKPHLKSYIYLVHNRKLTAWKIGIANSNKGRDRVEKHLENGWTLYKKKIVKTGTRARYIESECLRFLRIERKLTIHLSQKQMPQGGWTETVDSKKIRGSTIWAKVEELSKVKR
jgi:hypothetical protein